MNLIKWMSEVQDRVGLVLGMENISAQVIAAIQSPLVITYKLQLINPVKSQVDRMMNLSETMEQNLGIAPIRVYPQEGMFNIELPSPIPVTPHGDLLAEYTEGANLCVGIDTSAKPAYVALPRFPSILWVAPPGAGKTSSARSIAYAILKNNNAVSEKVSFLICAEKLDAWRAFVNVRGVIDVVSEFSDMRVMLSALSGTLSKKAQSGERFDPPIIVLVDDLLRVLSQEKEIAKYLGEIASTGRSAGMYLFLITQSSGSNAGTGGIQVEDNIAARIVYRTTSKTSAARSTGEDSAGISELTTVHGDALLVLGSTKKRIATGYVEDSDIVALPQSDGSPSKLMRDLVLSVKESASQVSITKPIKGGERHVDREETITEPVAQLPLTMAKISPPRELNLGEIRHLRLIVNHYAQSGQPLSKNKLMHMLFGGKNDKYYSYLQTALDRIKEINVYEANHI